MPVFIVALFTILKMWKQSKYSSSNEQRRTTWYTHTMDHFSALPKGHSTVCNNMSEP